MSVAPNLTVETSITTPKDTTVKHTKTLETNNPYAYTGRELDTNDLYYYRARYYDPSLQRFLGEDSIGFMSKDFNFYRYVFNSPINYFDSSGLDSNSASVGDILCGIATAPVTGATVITTAGENADGLIAGTKALKKNYDRNKKFDKCVKKKKKTKLECQLDYYGQ